MPFINLPSTHEQALLPGFKVTFVHSERMTLAYWDIEAGAILPEHSHPHEQVATILQGQFELCINGETQVLDPSTIGVIPPNALHSGRALTNCQILDAFCPVREDYR